MSKKSPFGNYTVEQVFASEAVTYIVQMDYGLFVANGKWIFDKKSASRYYNKILKELVGQIHGNDERQKRSAKRTLLSLKIVPLRVH